MMKLTIDDPRVTAYAFGELDPSETKEVAKLVAADAELKKAVDEMIAIESIFNAGSDATYSLRPEQRAAIFESSPEPGNVVHIPEKSWAKRVVAVLGVAAAVVISVSVLQRPSDVAGEAVAQLDWSSLTDSEIFQRVSPSSEAWENQQTTTDGGGGSAVSEALQMHASAIRNEIADRAKLTDSPTSTSSQMNTEVVAWTNRADKPESRIPLVAGNASYAWVEKSLGAGKLPSPASVRVEELLNHLPSPSAADISHRGVGAGVEILQSPLNSNELWVLLTFNAQQSLELEAALEFSESVKSYRLLGYQQQAGGLKLDVFQAMKGGQSHQVAYALQVEDLYEPSAPMLHLHLRQKGDAEQASLAVVYSEREWRDMSPAGKMQVLVVSWAAWLNQPSRQDWKITLNAIVADVAGQQAVDMKVLDTVRASLEL